MESEQVFVSSQSPDEDAGETKAYNSIGSLSILLICPECQETPPNIFENTSSGDTVCLSCGLVLGEHMVDTRSEWRTFSDHNTRDNDPCRVGNAADPLFDGSQLETRISWDGSSRSRALNRAQTLLRDNTNNSNLTAAYTRIYTICQTLHLTDDATRLAQAIYKEVYNQDAFKRKNVNKTIAGCVFIASRKTKHDRTFKDITEASGVTVKDLSWAFKAIEHFFKQHKKTTQQETGVLHLCASSEMCQLMTLQPSLLALMLRKVPRSLSCLPRDIARGFSYLVRPVASRRKLQRSSSRAASSPGVRQCPSPQRPYTLHPTSWAIQSRATTLPRLLPSAQRQFANRTSSSTPRRRS